MDEKLFEDYLNKNLNKSLVLDFIFYSKGLSFFLLLIIILKVISLSFNASTDYIVNLKFFSIFFILVLIEALLIARISEYDFKLLNYGEKFSNSNKSHVKFFKLDKIILFVLFCYNIILTLSYLNLIPRFHFVNPLFPNFLTLPLIWFSLVILGFYSFKKFFNWAQILSLLFIFLGGICSIHAVGITTIDLSVSFYSLVFVLGLSFIFLILFPYKGILITLFGDNGESKLALFFVLTVPLIFAAVSYGVFYLDRFDLLLIPRLIISSSFFIAGLLIFLLLYSRRLSFSDYSNELSEINASDTKIFFEDLIENLVEGVLVTDAEDNIVYLNKFMEIYFNGTLNDHSNINEKYIESNFNPNSDSQENSLFTYLDVVSIILDKSSFIDLRNKFKRIFSSNSKANDGNMNGNNNVNSYESINETNGGNNGSFNKVSNSIDSGSVNLGEYLFKTDKFSFFEEEYEFSKKYLRQEFIDSKKINGQSNDLFLSAWIIPRIVDGNFEGAIITVSDFTETKKKESGLKSLINEKNILLTEVHHRVKNNLQIIISLLNLQSSKLDEPYVKSIIKEIQNRIRAMALIHESLYKNLDFAKVNSLDYFSNLTNEIKGTYVDLGDIYFDLAIDEVYFDLDTVVPLGLIINELLTNAIKYAFSDLDSDEDKGISEVYKNMNKENSNKILLSLTEFENNHFNLTISDNGIGVDLTNFNPGIGLNLVDALVQQLEGEYEIISNNGFEVSIDFEI